MDRRTLLKGTAPVALSLLALPADANARPESPIQRLFHQWKKVFARAERPEATEEEVSALLDEMHVLEQEILRQPAETMADLATKVVAYTNDGAFTLADNAEAGVGLLWAELRLLANGGVA
jgi:hypothetical protein